MSMRWSRWLTLTSDRFDIIFDILGLNKSVYFFVEMFYLLYFSVTYTFYTATNCAITMHSFIQF